MNVDTDEYGDAITTPTTSILIAEQLLRKKAVFLGWTDNHGTHLDILFAYNVPEFGGNFQRGIQSTDLFVCIMGGKSFGFEVQKTILDAGYVSEKLGVSGETAEWLAALITFVRVNLIKYTPSWEQSRCTFCG